MCPCHVNPLCELQRVARFHPTCVLLISRHLPCPCVQAETRAGRDKAALLKAKRANAVEQQREKQKQAFIKQQARGRRRTDGAQRCASFL